MESREQRVAHNEATAREVNESIERALAKLGGLVGEGQHIRVLCECGRGECNGVLAITLPEYEAVRADPRTFAVAHGHEEPDIERTLAGTDRYVVVAKREGIPARIAIERDPRA